MKRKSSEALAIVPPPADTAINSLSFSEYLTRFKRTKKNSVSLQNNLSGRDKIKIRIKDQVQVDKGYFNLPKEVLEEAFGYLHNVQFLSKIDTGRGIYYYDCATDGCSYRIKVTENPELIKNLQTSILISNYKNFDCTNCSDLKDGICFITEYGQHFNDHHKQEDNKARYNKQGKYQYLLALIYLYRGFSISKNGDYF